MAMLMGKKIFASLTLLACFVGLATFNLCLGQSSGATAGAIVGTVRDGQGAVIEGAEITARQLETNLIRQLRTQAQGNYTLAQLPPGRYEISARAEGFTTSTEMLTLTLGT